MQSRWFHQRDIDAQLALSWKRTAPEITQALQNIAGFDKATFEFIFNLLLNQSCFAICD